MTYQLPLLHAGGHGYCITQVKAQSLKNLLGYWYDDISAPPPACRARGSWVLHQSGKGTVSQEFIGVTTYQLPLLLTAGHGYCITQVKAQFHKMGTVQRCNFFAVIT